MIQDDQDHPKTGAWRERLIASHLTRWDEGAMITADGRPQAWRRDFFWASCGIARCGARRQLRDSGP